VAWIGRAADVPAGGAGKTWNIGGKVLTPGLVDFEVLSEGGMRWDLKGRCGGVGALNPPGYTREAADIFRRFLEGEGIRHRTEAPQAAKPNLIASFTGARPGRHVVLNGHLDVFPIGDSSVWQRERSRARPRHGRHEVRRHGAAVRLRLSPTIAYAPSWPARSR
jgi:acetylornithine deacetylase/succinyl-diaminopimelate desuccinylase-like protein